MFLNRWKSSRSGLAVKLRILLRFDLHQSTLVKRYINCRPKLDEDRVMKIFMDLFSDWTGLLTLGIILFMLVMMGYLSIMFISKMNHKE